MRRQSFGNTPDGRAVELYTFGAPGFIEISVMTYGATLQRVLAPSRKGERTNVVLGFDTVEGYTANDGHYFGATIGRTANRISGGRFTLDGRKHQVAPKDGVDALHGGSRGFDKHVWQVTSLNERRITLRLVSPHGDMGYPGTLVVQVTYLVVGNSITIDDEATTDASTIVNLTNHTCWNLAGEGSGSVDDHVLTVNASAYTPVGRGLIPTVEIAPVAETPFDFRTQPPSVADSATLTHNSSWLTASTTISSSIENADGTLQLAARLAERRSRRVLEVRTTEPGIQLYTGNKLDGSLAGPTPVAPTGKATAWHLKPSTFLTHQTTAGFHQPSCGQVTATTRRQSSALGDQRRGSNHPHPYPLLCHQSRHSQTHRCAR